MNRKNKLEKWEEERNLAITWANALISNSTHEGVLPKGWGGLDIKLGGFSEEEIDKMRRNSATLIKWRIMQSVPQTVPGTFNIDAVVKEVDKYRILTEEFLKDEHYIEQKGDKWVLSEKGALAKDLGGHEGYVKFRRSEINIIKNQGKINCWLLVAALLAGIVPLGTFVVDKVWFSDKPQSEPVHHIEVKVDANSLNKSDGQPKLPPPKTKGEESKTLQTVP